MDIAKPDSFRENTSQDEASLEADGLGVKIVAKPAQEVWDDKYPFDTPDYGDGGYYSGYYQGEHLAYSPFVADYELRKLRHFKPEEQHMDQQFIDYVVKALVDHPDDVKVVRTVDEMGVLITLHVNPEDMGQVIGRQGQTARSVRTLLRVVGAKNNARVNMKIFEPEGSRGPRRSREESAAMSGEDEGNSQAQAPRQSGPDTSIVDDLKI